MSSYSLTNVFLQEFYFKPKHWFGSFNITLEKNDYVFFSTVSFSFNKNWHFNDFTFPFDCTLENRIAIKTRFHEMSEPLRKSLLHHHVYPREQYPFLPTISNFQPLKIDAENNSFRFSFNLSQHQPIFFLDVFEKNNVFHYKISCSKKFYENHITCLYFDFHLFNKLYDLLLDINDIRYLFSTTPFVHKEKPTINF